MLLLLHTDPVAHEALAYGFVAHFAPVSDERHDDIRETAAAAERSGFAPGTAARSRTSAAPEAGTEKRDDGSQTASVDPQSITGMMTVHEVAQNFDLKPADVLTALHAPKTKARPDLCGRSPISTGPRCRPSASG